MPTLSSVVLMGVSGAGKSTIAVALAEELDVRFIEGDEFHPPQNVQKMSRGMALTDEDRWPWLDRLGDELRAQERSVLTCSALKLEYRDRLRASGVLLRFLLLDVSESELQRRLEARKDHYMPPSLLKSQLALLEDGPDVERVPAEQDPEVIVEEILATLNRT